jgi:hypothetical protein
VGTQNQAVVSLQVDLQASLASPDGIVAIAVGYAEGNRTIDGGRTKGYYGHTDPGNGRLNIGSFSYQAYTGNITNPEAADYEWLSQLRKRLLPRYIASCSRHQLPQDNAFLWVSACDLYTQAPAAVVLRGGLLDQMARPDLMTISGMVTARVASYYEPDGRLNAPGFGNNPARLRTDQMRRTLAIIDALKRWSQGQ